MHPGAGRPVEHPGWNFQPTARIGTAQATAKISAVRSLDRRMNADPKAKPWMPRVQQFSKLSSVGVLKLCCTTMLGRTVRWPISHRPNLPLAALQDRNGAERCATRRAPRPAPLLHRARRAQMPLGLSPSLDEPRGLSRSLRERHKQNSTLDCVLYPTNTHREPASPVGLLFFRGRGDRKMFFNNYLEKCMEIFRGDRA